MKNYEKYVDKIKEYGGNNFCSMFIEPHILKPIGLSCGDLTCGACRVLQLVWLTKGGDPKEPEIDWSKVEVDTPIMVRDDGVKWVKRHFAKYENEIIYAWNSGATSWSTSCMTGWKYAKLAESEVDWSKVEVDTPILVRYSEKGMWIRRKFAKFEDGVVYAWHGKETGHSKSYMTPWNYAKLAESERKDNISESNANNRG